VIIPATGHGHENLVTTVCTFGQAKLHQPSWATQREEDLHLLSLTGLHFRYKVAEEAMHQRVVRNFSSFWVGG
jgi:hypothetical protein